MTPGKMKDLRAMGTPVANMKPRASVADNRASGKPAANHTGGRAVNENRVNPGLGKSNEGMKSEL